MMSYEWKERAAISNGNMKNVKWKMENDPLVRVMMHRFLLLFRWALYY